METITQIILSFLGIIGIGGIITAFFNKSKEIEFQKLQNKEKRYKCAILLMEACLDLEKLKHIEGFRDELKTKVDVIGGLTFEYNQMLLYSSQGNYHSNEEVYQCSLSRRLLYNIDSHAERFVD